MGTKKEKKEFKAEVQRNLSQMSLIINRSTKNLESYSDSEGSTSSQEENSSVNQKHENKFAPRQAANDIDNLNKRFVTDLKELKDHLISDINARPSSVNNRPGKSAASFDYPSQQQDQPTYDEYFNPARHSGHTVDHSGTPTENSRSISKQRMNRTSHDFKTN